MHAEPVDVFAVPFTGSLSMERYLLKMEGEEQRIQGYHGSFLQRLDPPAVKIP